MERPQSWDTATKIGSRNMNKMSWPYSAGSFPTICRTEGLYLYDAADRPILDAAGGAVVTNIGHGRQRVAKALGRAAEATS